MRTELFKTDPDSAGSKRSEWAEQGGAGLNGNRWMGLSYFFPTATYGFDNSPEIILQWHHNLPTGSPPFAIWTWRDHFYCTTRLNPGDGDTTRDMGVIPKDRWNDIIVHYNQRSDAQGQIQIWINSTIPTGGTPTLTINGPVSFAGITNYFKLGIYKWQWKSAPGNSSQTHRLFYIDEIRYGNQNATFYDVAPGAY